MEDPQRFPDPPNPSPLEAPVPKNERPIRGPVEKEGVPCADEGVVLACGSCSCTAVTCNAVEIKKLLIDSRFEGYGWAWTLREECGGLVRTRELDNTLWDTEIAPLWGCVGVHTG